MSSLVFGEQFTLAPILQIHVIDEELPISCDHQQPWKLLDTANPNGVLAFRATSGHIDCNANTHFRNIKSGTEGELPGERLIHPPDKRELTWPRCRHCCERMTTGERWRRHGPGSSRHTPEQEGSCWLLRTSSPHTMSRCQPRPPPCRHEDTWRLSYMAWLAVRFFWKLMLHPT